MVVGNHGSLSSISSKPKLGSGWKHQCLSDPVTATGSPDTAVLHKSLPGAGLRYSASLVAPSTLKFVGRLVYTVVIGFSVLASAGYLSIHSYNKASTHLIAILMPVGIRPEEAANWVLSNHPSVVHIIQSMSCI